MVVKITLVYTINYVVCQSIQSVFIVHGIYRFECTAGVRKSTRASSVNPPFKNTVGDLKKYPTP